MKREVFEEYTDKVTQHFEVSREQLFTKDKNREVVDARHTLYYLCSHRPMPNTYIKKYMGDNGYDIALSSIGHGIKRIAEQVDTDPDYTTLINKLK